MKLHTLFIAVLFLHRLLCGMEGFCQSYQYSQRVGSVAGDRGNGIVVGKSGNFYITGYYRDTLDFDPGAGTAILNPNGTLQKQEIFVAKYDAFGNYRWAFRIVASNDDVAYGIALDSSENVHITGSISATADFDPGVGTANVAAGTFFAKYDSSGNYLWAKSISIGTGLSQAMCFG